MTLEYKTIALKGATTAGDLVTGVASTFGPPADSYGDIIEPGAYTKDLAERGKVRPALWQHDTRELLGAVTLTEDAKGLRAAFSLVPEVQRAREAMALAKSLQSLLGISIGYEPVKSHMKKSTRHITEIRLYEVSLVTMPANDRARVDVSTDDLQALASTLETLTTKAALDAAFRDGFRTLKGTRP